MIQKADIESIYPLSPMQEGLLFDLLMKADSGYYFSQAIYTIEGQFDVEAFCKAWDKLASGCDILRTAFTWKAVERMVQIVFRHAAVPIDCQDWRGLKEEDRRPQMESYLESDRRRGFDLARPPLLRCALLHLEENVWRFVLSHHHVLLDGWSLSQLLKDAFVCYEAFNRVRQPQLPERRKFRDYVDWLQQQDSERAEAFWKTYFKDFTSPTPLPGTGRGSESGLGEKVVCFAADETIRLKRFSQDKRITLNTLLQAAWGLLLGRYCGSSDVVFGTTVSGRPASLRGIEQMIGLFINALPVRVNWEPEERVVPWLEKLQLQQAAAREYEYTSLVQIHGWSHVPREIPLFQTLFAYGNYPLALTSKDLKTASEIRVSETRVIERPNFSLVINAYSSEELQARFTIDRSRFEKETVERLVGHWQTLVRSICRDDLQKVVDVEWLTDEERSQLLIEWKGATGHQQLENCLHELFAAQAAQTPDAVAVVYDAHQLSYAEVDWRANQLGHYLRQHGVEPETRVAVCMERCAEMVPAFLGIMKAGGAYVPLDPGYPHERLLFMVKDAQPRVLLVERQFRGHFLGSDALILCIEEVWQGRKSAIENKAAWSVAMDPANGAYVIYTSGSTGQPKGVVVSHGNVVRLVDKTQHWFNFKQDVWTLFHSYAFDFSVWELWGALLHGGRLVVVPYWVSRSPEDFRNLLVRERVTVLNQTPSAFQQLMRADERVNKNDLSLRFVIFGGEALEFRSLRGWLEHHPEQPQLVNMYGITETTVHVTYQPIQLADIKDKEGVSRIGVPIDDLRVYVLDGEMHLLPAGVKGELYVGGAGVARGYLNRPELTAERFVPSPFLTLDSDRLYRTGDQVARRNDGSLDYFGRLDQQVKIRGYRIELGEIERVIGEHDEVRQCVVVLYDDKPGYKQLVASVVLKGSVREGEQDWRTELQEHARRKLPEYMVPSTYILLDKLPLTGNGKINRKALPRPESQRDWAMQTYAPPRTPLEEILCGVWEEVLGLPRVGVWDSFFDLGGHSLLATQIVSRIRQVLHVELPLRELMSNPTIAQLALYVERARAADTTCDLPPLTVVDRRGALPLSLAQERLWFVDQMASANALYNVLLTVQMKGRLQVEALSGALTEIIRRHEVLRTIFPQNAGIPCQAIQPPKPIALSVIDLSEMGDSGQFGIEASLTRSEAHHRFVLSQGPLLRFSLLKLERQHHRLLITMHHIVCDGWSMGILVREFSALYTALCSGRAAGLSDLKMQYADFSQWQRGWLQGAVLDRQVQYWRTQLAGLRPLKLPVDIPIVRQGTGYWGATCEVSFPPELESALKTLCRQNGLTLFMALLAAWAYVLSQYAGAEDFAVGTDIANRNQLETEPLVGFFVNQLVLRIRLRGCCTVRDILNGVKEVTLDAYKNQDVPFQYLAQEFAGNNRDDEVLYQTKLVLQNLPLATAFEAPGLEMRAFVPETERLIQYPLMLTLSETPLGLAGVFDYAKDLFAEATIKLLHAQMVEVLHTAVKHPDSCLGDLAPRLAQIKDAARKTQQKQLWEASEKKWETLPRRRTLLIN